jgi:hypothetical protein
VPAGESDSGPSETLPGFPRRLVSVVVYDPNPFNPYGAELAHRLSLTGCPVTRWCPLGDPFAEFNHKRVTVFSPGASAASVPAIAITRVLGPMLFLSRHLWTRSIVIVPWALTTLDYVALIGLCITRRRVILIEHNPIAERNGTGLTAGLHRVLRRVVWGNVAHTSELKKRLGGERRFVAGHPSYSCWVSIFGRSVPTEEPRALVLGGLRRDKGREELQTLIPLLLQRGVRLLIAGRGDVPVGLEGLPGLELLGGEKSLSDGDVAKSVFGSGVLVAPYTDVTVSGTVIMALTAGLPVAAYRSPALQRVLSEDALVDSGDNEALADKVVDLLRRPRNVFRVASQQLDAECIRSWWKIIDVAKHSRY